jgi:hypothetical protein
MDSSSRQVADAGTPYVASFVNYVRRNNREEALGLEVCVALECSGDTLLLEAPNDGL